MRDIDPDLSHLERLLGDVLLEGEIARTPRAVVYRVRTGGGDRPLALKVALARSDAEDLARFRHEVRLLSEARHPNVVEVYDFGVLPGDFPFLTMELLKPEGLPERFRRLDWESFYDLALQAAAGLAHIHRQGVVHMDIKPLNLGLTNGKGVNGNGNGQRATLKILDFGLAQSVRGPLDRRIRGTLAYTAPEILLQDSYDHRADLYSLGMTLFELATGVLPSAGGDMAAVRFHLEGELPDPLSLRPDMPPALSRILTRLLQRDPADRYPSAGRLLADLGEASGRPVEAAAISEGTVLASRLIGRDEILARLRSALTAAAEGRGGALLIEGVEGVGKSRLLREFRLLAAVEGARVGRARDLAERSRPLEPFLEALASVGIEVQTGPEAPVGESVQRERYRLYREIALALSAGARTGPPILLILDDFHLAGRESEDLLAYLAEELRGSRALVVAARRPAQDGGRELESLPVLPLAPFDRRETTQLIDACLGSAGLLPNLYTWVHERSLGVPSEVQRLLRHLVEDRALLYRDGEWKPSLPALTRWANLSAAADAEAEEWGRISALPAPLRETLEAAAVIAGPLSLETLAALLGEDLQTVYERISALVERGDLERLREAEGSLYGIPQTRTRQALYTGMDSERRAELHRRLGFRLAEAGESGLAAAAAEHLWRGGERVRSLPHLLRAAEEASTVYGYAEAAGFHGRAAEAATEAGDLAVTASALASQAEALAAAGSFPRALRVYQELLTRPDLEPLRLADRALVSRALLRKGRLHTRLGEHEAALESHDEGLRVLAGGAEPELAVDLLLGRALALRDLGRWDAASSAARSALARAGQEGLVRQRASLLNTLGMFAAGRGDWRRAGRLVRRGLWVAEKTADEALCLTLRNNLGNILWKTGDFEGALGLYSRNLERCERTNDVWGQLSTLNNLGILECSRGNWMAAREPLTRSLELKRRLGLREKEALARLNLGEVEEVLGHWGRAERHYERALKLLGDMPEHRERFAALAQLASLDRKRGRSGEAERRAREALAGAERIGDRDLLAQCYHLLGQVEKDRDNLDAAGVHLKRALEIEEAAGTQQVLARVHISLADLALRSGDPAGAERHALEARTLVEEQGDRFTLAKLLSVEGRIASAREEVERAEHLFADGVRLLEELEAPYEHARSLYEWGLRTWNVDTALRRLRRALVGFERLGAENESKRTSGAIERIREHQRFSDVRGASAVLYEVLKVVNSTLDLQEVLNRTMDLVLERLGAERGMIVLVNRITRELEVAAVRNLGHEDEDEGRKLSESVVRRVVETREPVLAVDALTDGRFAGAESIVARHILSILCVPLAIRDRLAGAIYVDHRQSRHLFGPGDLEFLTAFADQAAIAIDNARLYGEIDAARQRLKEENESLRREVLSSHSLGSLIGRSRPISDLKQVLEKVAQSPSTVLIRGESGTGKGLVARIIHSISPRRQAAFIHFNCAALPETLVESELFGHEKGAFTGAAGQKPGRFELANHGTIFLDEIGKVSRAVQAKLLRVVEEKEFERVGGTRTLRADVRVIAATNLDLEEAIVRNEFREDLFYRLNIIPIVLPPLRQRREDVPYLVEHFLAKISRDLGRQAKEIDPAVLDLFSAYSWPGNVRELEAAIHRAFVLSEQDTLTVEDFGWIALHVQGTQAPVRRPSGLEGLTPTVSLSPGSYEEALDRYDRQLISVALAQSKGKIRETARLLGIARNTLRAKMKKYGLQGAGE
ncbi:MAG TPA: sigma 54-interacting transcriptional regulator [Thermoanaerobaculia bacterium]|nr:sigma 54-interacting transcriptional regulator [Thermoanaerobaculia bacterium]